MAPDFHKCFIGFFDGIDCFIIDESFKLNDCFLSEAIIKFNGNNLLNKPKQESAQNAPCMLDLDCSDFISKYDELEAFLTRFKFSLYFLDLFYKMGRIKQTSTSRARIVFTYKVSNFFRFLLAAIRALKSYGLFFEKVLSHSHVSPPESSFA